jgi:hypothetical protein
MYSNSGRKLSRFRLSQKGQYRTSVTFALPRPRVQYGDADGLMERLPPGVVAATELSLRWTRAAAVR